MGRLVLPFSRKDQPQKISLKNTRRG